MTKEKALKTVYEKYEIALCYLFGSYAEDAFLCLSRPDAVPDLAVDDPLVDIDIGIVMQKELPGADKRYQLYAEINNALADIFKPVPVDLRFLEENHSVFQVESIKGYCLYAISEKVKDDYEEMVLRKAADFKPILDLFLSEVLEDAVKDA